MALFKTALRSYLGDAGHAQDHANSQAAPHKQKGIGTMVKERASLNLVALCFRLALSLSLAVVILCALLPTNPATPRNVGSAFDPSTTVLSLKHRADDGAVHNRFVAKPDSDGTPDVGSASHLVPIFAFACALIVMLALRGTGSLQAPLGSSQTLSAPAQRPHGPRGPPCHRL